MKKAIALFLALSLALPLSGCARNAPWRFELDTRRDADDRIARDGTLLSWYSYELPYLRLLNADAAPNEQPPEAMAAVRDAFNAEMEHYRALLLDEYGEMEQAAIAGRLDGAEGFAPTGNHVELAETYQSPRLLSVRMSGYANWGGAYPWSAVRCWAFDLEAGKFVEWYDLAKDPDALRAALAAEIERQAREQGMDKGFYDSWEAEVDRFDGCDVYLGEDALTVIFGEQLLGPHAAGMPEFTISYDGLSQYLSDYGRQLLKKEG